MNYTDASLENLKNAKYNSFRANILSADIADMQLICKNNKGARILLSVIDINSNYAWVVASKDQKGITITNVFQNILKESGRKPNKIWVDLGSEFYNRLMKS